MRQTDERRGRARKPFNKEVRYDTLGEQPGRMINNEFTASGIDISEGGIGMKTAVSLERGRIMKIAIPVQVADVVISAFGEVAWSSHQGDHFGTGVRFIK